VNAERQVIAGFGWPGRSLVGAADYGPPRPAVLRCHQCGTDIEFWPPDENEELQVRCGQCGQTVNIRSSAASPGRYGA
jgi:DNA-directed RNA polymerase subunit RPC12/RpoP